MDNLLDDEGYPLFECSSTGAVIIPNDTFYAPAEIASLKEPEVVEKIFPMSVRANPRAPWTKQKKIKFVIGGLLGFHADGSPVVAPYVLDRGMGLPAGFTEVRSMPPKHESLTMDSYWKTFSVLRITSPSGLTKGELAKMTWGEVWAFTQG